jgi:uncharacterized membrane protein
MSHGPRSKISSGLYSLDLLVTLSLGLWAVGISFGTIPVLGQFGRGAIGLVAVLFAPGYALVAALFPRRGTAGLIDWIGRRSADATVTAIERLVLALGLSVCLAPLLGLGLYYTPRGIQPTLLVAAVGVTTVLCSVLAGVRRLRTPRTDRFDMRGFGRGLDTVLRDASGPVSVLNVALLVGLLVVASGIGFAAVQYDQGERFTEFYIVTEDAETGEYVAGDYPQADALADGTGRLHVGIANHERRPIEYTVVVRARSPDGVGETASGEGLSDDGRTLETFSVSVAPGETRMEPHAFDSVEVQTGSKVVYLLYAGEPPADDPPSADNAYRSTHFWVDEPTDDPDA